MASKDLDQLRDLARQDPALQLALDAATDANAVQGIAQQRGLALSGAEAVQWLAEQAALAASLSPAELDALSQGLSDASDNTRELSDLQLEEVAGGEALMFDIVGEAV
jgi:hypothetical protein